MVEEKKLDLGELADALGSDMTFDDFKKIMNDPRYLDTAEEEIEQMLKNAKVALTQLGFDLDKERLEKIDEEQKEEVDETELERLLAGGLPFCRKPLTCGHKCGGVKGESECPPCLEPDCMKETNLPEKTDLCNICYTCEMSEEPFVKIKCGHIYHANCILELLKHKWTTLRITFAFMSCPSCKAPIEADHVDEISDEREKWQVLRSQLMVKAMKIVRSQGLDKDPRVTTPGEEYYGDLMRFAEAKVSFYECADCAKPYFGGLIDCEQEMQMEDTTRREDLLCRPCLMKKTSIGRNICLNGHGAEFIDWKCMYCCSIALFCCNGGQRWFCDPCHRDPGKAIRKPKDCKGKNCPLKIPHPPAGDDHKKSAFPLGCSICRSEHLEEYDQAQAEIRAMLEEDPDFLKNADRSYHSTYQVEHRGGKKGKKGPPPQKKKAKKMAKAKPAPAKKKKAPAAGGKILRAAQQAQ